MVSSIFELRRINLKSRKRLTFEILQYDEIQSLFRHRKKQHAVAECGMRCNEPKCEAVWYDSIPYAMHLEKMHHYETHEYRYVVYQCECHAKFMKWQESRECYYKHRAGAWEFRCLRCKHTVEGSQQDWLKHRAFDCTGEFQTTGESSGEVSAKSETDAVKKEEETVGDGEPAAKKTKMENYA